MIANEPVTTMTLSRSKVSVSAYLEKTHLLGSTVEVTSSFDQAMKTLVLRLEAILYGRTVASDTTESNEITVEEFDPKGVQPIPATWWDHLKQDIASQLFRWSIMGRWSWWRRAIGWLYLRTISRIDMVPAPQSHRPRIIPQTVNTRKVTAVCPHVGSQVKLDRHLQFVAFNRIEPFTTLNVGMSSNGDTDAHPVENSRGWREHLFRHHLLAICQEMDRVFGKNMPSMVDPSFDYAKFHRHLMKIKDLFSQYGVGA